MTTPQVLPLGPRDPERLGGYLLHGRLGQGGQGIVYLGVNRDGDLVAVKALHAHLVADPDARARLARELRAARKVARFCTARVVAADVVADVPYVVTEYVDGPTLYRRVTEAGPLGADALRRMAVGVATALVVIHRAQVVHRDLKPHNVILSPEGPRVIDFGIARPLELRDSAGTVAGHLVGTPGYLAPEYATGGEVGPPADVFAWAATVAWAASGRPAFGYGTPLEVIGRAIHAEPTLSNLPPLLDELVRAGLNKDPEARPSAEELLSRLLAAGSAVGQVAVGHGVQLDEATAEISSVVERGARAAVPAPRTPPSADAWPPVPPTQPIPAAALPPAQPAPAQPAPAQPASSAAGKAGKTGTKGKPVKNGKKSIPAQTARSSSTASTASTASSGPTRATAPKAKRPSPSSGPTESAARPAPGWLHDWHTWLAIAFGTTVAWAAMAVTLLVNQPDGALALTGLIPIYAGYWLGRTRASWAIAIPIGVATLVLCESYLVRLAIDQPRTLVLVVPMVVVHPLAIAAVARYTRLALRPPA